MKRQSETEIGRAGAGARRRQAANKPSPAEEQFNMIVRYPVSLIWSDGTQTAATLNSVFNDESDYLRYKKYKDSGKPYPVRAEAIPPADSERDNQSSIFPNDTKADEYGLVAHLCNEFSSALQQYLGIDPHKQAEEASRIIERQAQEATEAMSKGLPDLEGAEL